MKKNLSQIKQASAIEEEKTNSENLNGQIRLTTETVTKNPIIRLMMFPDLSGQVAEVLGLE